MRFLPLSLVALSACGAFDPDPTLAQFEDCEQMRSYMKKMAIKENSWRYRMGFSIGVGSNEMTVDDAGAINPMDTIPDFSKTNTQEEGVDEADLVKTDGLHLFAASFEEVVISSVYPLEDAGELSRVKVKGQVSGIYLRDQQLVVTSGEWIDGMAGGPRSRVSIFDITTLRAPKLVKAFVMKGTLESSRRIDSRLFMVMYHDFEISPGSYQWGTSRKAIKEANPEDWLPEITVITPGEEKRTEKGCGCDEMWASPRGGGTYYTSVYSLDLNDLAKMPEGDTVVGRADIIYANEKSVYIAAIEENEGPFSSVDNSVDTIIHRFDIQSQNPTYAATAQVVGMLPDQFALSEYNDVLRVATTETLNWSSAVHTLKLADGEATHIDTVDQIAPGERLFATRFIGDRAYLVTYVVDDDGFGVPYIDFGDPLFAVDLHDPENLQILGELQIDGWSDYIHPLNDDFLVTVGMDSPNKDQDWQLTVSLFDVSNPKSPKLAQRLFMGASSSQAQLDHHAFTWYPERELLAIPTWSLEGRSELALVKVNTQGLTDLGRASQDLFEEDQWCSPVRRSVFIDDDVWAVSTSGATVSAIDDPGTNLNTLLFTESCDRGMWWW